jgi:hypothetical protein
MSGFVWKDVRTCLERYQDIFKKYQVYFFIDGAIKKGLANNIVAEPLEIIKILTPVVVAPKYNPKKIKPCAKNRA